MTAKGYIYDYNGNRYTIQEQLHRRYQADPQSAEQLFLADIHALLPASLSNRVGGQNNRRQDTPPVDQKQGPTSEEIASSQNVQSFRPNKPLNSQSNIHFPSSPSSASGQIPTQTFSQASRPNSPASSPNSDRPLSPSSPPNRDSNSPYSDRPLSPSSSQNRDRPLLSSPPVRDSESISTQATGFNKEIPEERERENNRNPTAAVTDFAWNLFKNSNTLPNFVLSPLSPQILMSYLAYVADGQTRDELVNVNGFGNPDQIQTIVASMLSDGGGRDLQIATAFFVSQEMR